MKLMWVNICFASPRQTRRPADISSSSLDNTMLSLSSGHQRTDLRNETKWNYCGVQESLLSLI